MKARHLFVSALLVFVSLCAPRADGATISVGNLNFLPNEKTVFPIWVTNSDVGDAAGAQGLVLYTEVKTAKITGIGVVDPGCLFANNNTGEYISVLDEHVWNAETTTANATLPFTTNILAYLQIDTTGVTVGTQFAIKTGGIYTPTDPDYPIDSNVALLTTTNVNGSGTIVASAAPKVWAKAGNGYWNDPSNWAPYGVPDGATDAVIDGPFTVVCDGPTFFHNGTIQGGGTWQWTNDAVVFGQTALINTASTLYWGGNSLLDPQTPATGDGPLVFASMASVPEPSTLALLASGAAGLALLKRRQIRTAIRRGA
jgi:hypothetical protein